MFMKLMPGCCCGGVASARWSGTGGGGGTTGQGSINLVELLSRLEIKKLKFFENFNVFEKSSNFLEKSRIFLKNLEFS